jgi:hypothetical protein
MLDGPNAILICRENFQMHKKRGQTKLKQDKFHGREVVWFISPEPQGICTAYQSVSGCIGRCFTWQSLQGTFEKKTVV